MKTLCNLKLMRGMGMLRRSLIVKPIMGRRVKEMSVASDGGIMAIYIGTYEQRVPILWITPNQKMHSMKRT